MANENFDERLNACKPFVVVQCVCVFVFDEATHAPNGRQAAEGGNKCTDMAVAAGGHFPYKCPHKTHTYIHIHINNNKYAFIQQQACACIFSAAAALASSAAACGGAAL